MQLAANDRDTPCARVLCLGDDVDHLLEMQQVFGTRHEFVIVTSASAGDAAVLSAESFQLIISGERTLDMGFGKLLLRLRLHSPDAERIVFVKTGDALAVMMAAREARVMRVLTRPCSAVLLREAVNAALLRNRARCLRAAMAHTITPPSSVVVERRIAGLVPR